MYFVFYTYKTDDQLLEKKRSPVRDTDFDVLRPYL